MTLNKLKSLRENVIRIGIIMFSFKHFKINSIVKN